MLLTTLKALGFLVCGTAISWTPSSAASTHGGAYGAEAVPTGTYGSGTHATPSPQGTAPPTLLASGDALPLRNCTVGVVDDTAEVRNRLIAELPGRRQQLPTPEACLDACLAEPLCACALHVDSKPEDYNNDDYADMDDCILFSQPCSSAALFLSFDGGTRGEALTPCRAYPEVPAPAVDSTLGDCAPFQLTSNVDLTDFFATNTQPGRATSARSTAASADDCAQQCIDAGYEVCSAFVYQNPSNVNTEWGCSPGENRVCRDFVLEGSGNCVLFGGVDVGGFNLKLWTPVNGALGSVAGSYCTPPPDLVVDWQARCDEAIPAQLPTFGDDYGEGLDAPRFLWLSSASDAVAGRSVEELIDDNFDYSGEEEDIFSAADDLDDCVAKCVAASDCACAYFGDAGCVLSRVACANPRYGARTRLVDDDAFGGDFLAVAPCATPTEMPAFPGGGNAGAFQLAEPTATTVQQCPNRSGLRFLPNVSTGCGPACILQAPSFGPPEFDTSEVDYCSGNCAATPGCGCAYVNVDDDFGNRFCTLFKADSPACEYAPFSPDGLIADLEIVDSLSPSVLGMAFPCEDLIGVGQL